MAATAALGWGGLDRRQADPSQRHTVKAQEAVAGKFQLTFFSFSSLLPPNKGG